MLTLTSNNGGETTLSLRYSATEPIVAVGSLNVDVSSTYIVDAARWASDAAYADEHPEAIIQSAPFSGSLEGVGALPPTAAVSSMAVVQRASAGLSGGVEIIVAQQSFADAGRTTLIAPQAELVFFGDAITPGVLALDAGELGASGSAALFVLDLPEGGTPCVAAVAHLAQGLVSSAVDTTSAEGGRLALSISDVPLFLPTNTPVGDVSPAIIQAGRTTCVEPEVVVDGE